MPGLTATAHVGVELAHVDAPALDLRTPATSSFPLRYALPGTAFGASVAARFGAFTIGVDYQRTQFIREILSSDRVFAQAGLWYMRKWMTVGGHLDFGYANLAGDARTAHGVGGKLALAIDFFPIRWLSLGAESGLDAGAYFAAPTVGTYGATFVFRVGLRL